MIRQTNTLLIIVLSFLVAHWIRHGYTALEFWYVQALVITLALAAIVMPATGAFRNEFQWDLLRKMRRLLAGWAVVLMMLVSLAAMLKVSDQYSRIWFGVWVLLSNAGLVVLLLISHSAAMGQRRRAQARRRIILVGAGEAAARVEERIENDPAAGMELAARFGRAWDDQTVRPLDELQGYIEESGVREIWIATPLEDKELLDRTLDLLRETVVDVNVVPDLHQYRLLNQSISEWGGLPVVNLSGTPMTGAEMNLKNIFDRVVSALLIVLLSPLMLLIALWVRLESRGPVLFRQLRHGFGGEPIKILKFRTMVEHRESSGTVTQARPDDERFTRSGRFLRATSLDELPQLFNVLAGQMSLVGPRPHAVEHNDLYKSRIPRYMLRHRVKPGITGWAQVNGYRGLTDTEQKMAIRIEHDLWYIQNWSLWLDIRILLMTPFAMVHSNAY